MSRRDRIERNRHADCGVSYGECARAIAAETSTVGTTGENTVGFSKEMVAALEADGEKLRQLTGDLQQVAYGLSSAYGQQRPPGGPGGTSGPQQGGGNDDVIDAEFKET